MKSNDEYPFESLRDWSTSLYSWFSPRSFRFPPSVSIRQSLIPDVTSLIVPFRNFIIHLIFDVTVGAMDWQGLGVQAPVEKGHGKEHGHLTFIGIRFGIGFWMTYLGERRVLTSDLKRRFDRKGINSFTIFSIVVLEMQCTQMSFCDPVNPL